MRRRTAMASLEGDENLAIGGADSRVIAERQIHALWNADVVEHEIKVVRRNDFANRVLDAREDLLRLFETRASGRVHVQTELAGIDCWKEIAADHWQDHKRTADHKAKESEQGCSILQRPGQRIDVTLTENLKVFLEGLLNAREGVAHRFFAFVTTDEILHHHRHQRP